MQDLCHWPAGVKDGSTTQVDLDPLGPGGEAGQAQGQLQVMAQHRWLQHLELAGDAGLGGRLQEVITPETTAAPSADPGPPSRGFHTEQLLHGIAVHLPLLPGPCRAWDSMRQAPSSLGTTTTPSPLKFTTAVGGLKLAAQEPYADLSHRHCVWIWDYLNKILISYQRQIRKFHITIEIGSPLTYGCEVSYNKQSWHFCRLTMYQAL